MSKHRIVTGKTTPVGWWLSAIGMAIRAMVIGPPKF